jgi:MFS family permease
VTHGAPPGREPGNAPRGRTLNPFAGLRHRNFRLFFFGQLISLVGTWMQRIAQAWLVLQLTNSPLLLGIVGALQWTPMLLLSLFGGVVADRVSKRNLLIVTQTAQMLQALALGLLVLTGVVRYWHIVVFACVLGLTSAFDTPARQSFIFEMVEGADTMNAVALNSTIFNTARLFGPAVAGIAIASVGMAWAFLANAASFVPVIAAFAMMRLRPLQTVEIETGVLAHLREGLVYLIRTPVAIQTIALVCLQSVFVMNFNIIVPVLAKNVLHQDAGGFGLLMSAQGAGALVGALFIASLSHLGPHPAMMYGGAALLGATDLLLAGARHFGLAAAVLAAAGASMVAFTAAANTTLQIAAPDHMRGRVMSMYALVMGGMTPAGALFTGAVAEFWGAPAELAIAGAIGVCSAAAVFRWHQLTRPAVNPAGAAPAAASGNGNGGEQ